MRRLQRESGPGVKGGRAPAIYGLRGITHGGGVWMALVSAEDTDALRRRVGSPRGLAADTDDGGPLRYLEITAGALDELVRRHGILELDYSRWQAKKSELSRARTGRGIANRVGP